MLKTNGDITARETYGDECCNLVIVPARSVPSGPVYMGLVKYKIHYRFAGMTRVP